MRIQSTSFDPERVETRIDFTFDREIYMAVLGQIGWIWTRKSMIHDHENQILDEISYWFSMP